MNLKFLLCFRKEIDEFVENENEISKEIKFSDFLLRIFIEKNIKQKFGEFLMIRKFKSLYIY